MSTYSPDDEHFDELEAVRRFPSEEEWLDLPLPAEEDWNGEPAQGFADRVLRAREEELAIDEGLERLDEELPRALLEQFAAPEPSTDFVARTAAQVLADRRQRWQEMLARHVSPEPSPEFVSRTLAALRDDTADRAADRGAGRAAGPATRERAPRPAPQPTLAPRGWSSWSTRILLVAAAAAMLWLALTDPTRPPLEERLADRASPALAWSESTTPMGAILAGVHHQEEPYAVFDDPADGLWLVRQTSGDAEGKLR